MDKKLKAKWLSALRSGAFDQTTGSMRTQAGDLYSDTRHQSHCCLDVLICVSGERRGPQMISHRGRDEDYQLVESIVGGKKIRMTLQDLNDLDRKSFRQIADYIAANL